MFWSNKAATLCISLEITMEAETFTELRIVLVDDSLLIHEYMKLALLGIKGCNLVGTASDGDEGLAMIQMLRPDVVLLDVAMPQKNGVEVLRELRKENSKVIVIMFTADSNPAIKEKCLQVGADYFVVKTEFHELVDILAKLQKD